MKRIILLLMSLILLVSCLSGCKQENEQQDNVQSITDEEACEQAIDRLMQTVELPAAAQKDLVVEQVRHYDDESVVQYQQTFQGIDVYGSSVMVSTGKDGLCLGDYYDLSDAFGEDFGELVSEAERQPQWMGDQTDGDVTLSYRTSTLKPVILILPDQSAVIARQVEAEYTNATCKVDCTMVLSLDGTQLYDLRTDRVAYQAATVTGLGEESTSVVFENDRYYAYNPELNFYVYSGDETDANDHVNNNGATVDLSLMYFNKNADWTTGRAKRVFQAMTAYTDVATWYETVLGYQGIDGKGGAAMLVLSDQVSGSVAMNAHRYGYITYLYKTKHGYTAVDAPEILAHEYGHAVIKNISGTNGSGQTAALCEAICDSFGAAYCGDWHLAANLAVDGTDKDIPGTKLTHMDDYIYDTLDDYGRVFNDFVDNPLYTFGYEIYEHTSLLGFIDQYVTMSSDAYNYHDNAFIVSHTLYRIWDKVFNKNNDVFASVLYNSIRYLPSNANFSQFRSAFLYAARKVFDTEKVAYASTFFDVAGIASAGNASLVNLLPADDSTDPDTDHTDVKHTLIEQYGLSSQAQFVSGLGSEIQTYPAGIYGIISMIYLDINNDKDNELFVLRVSQTDNNEEAQIIAEVYQNTGNALQLCTLKKVYNVSFCTASNIYLFYSDTLSKYCLMIDSYSSGSYTGVNSWSAKVYTITNDSIDEYGNWESVPFVGISVDFESEFKKINVPYAKYCTTYDNQNNAPYYQPLCEVEHEIFGDSSTYMTRNHKLKIKSTTDQENIATDDTNSNASVMDYLLNTKDPAVFPAGTLKQDGSMYTGSFGQMKVQFQMGTDDFGEPCITFLSIQPNGVAFPFAYGLTTTSTMNEFIDGMQDLCDSTLVPLPEDAWMDSWFGPHIVHSQNVDFGVYEASAYWAVGFRAYQLVLFGGAKGRAAPDSINLFLCSSK